MTFNRFNLRQIEVFRSIMVTGSISRAADLLNVSQPAVSRLLSHTEQRLGLVLFERIKGRLHPTPEARRLLTEVNAVYQGVLRVNEVAEDLIEHRQGHLRVACSPSLGQGLIPRAVALFLQKHPDARVSIFTLVPLVLTQALLTQQADLGVVLLPEPHPNLLSQPLYGNRLLVALPTKHPLTSKESVSLGDLAGESFIGYGSDMPIGALVRQLFLDAGLSLRPKVDAQQVHVACSLVQQGVGLALIDEITATGPVWTQVVTRPLEVVIDIPVHIQRSAFEPLSRLGHAFVETMEGMKADWTR
jgi:DNA-binding transcriptional LysR family regulator